jgi:pimeloyl-ACP methyl ester carboxylesterase
LGTGVAAYLAGRFPGRVAGVCLLAPYTRLSDVGAAQFPWLPVRLLMRDRYPSADHLQAFHGPLAVLVGEADSTVPAELGRRLHAGYDGPKRLWNFPGQEHWEVIEQPANVWLEVLRFLLPE